MPIVGGALFLLVVIGAVLYFITVYNSLVGVRNEVERSWANIDVLLKQRFDELPRLVETCRGYMKHEREALQRIVEARTAWMNAATVNQKLDAHQLSAGALQSLFAVAEGYPELKSSTNFLQLQGRISTLETQVADRRELYNDAVNTHNIRIAQLPDVFVARMLGYTDRTLFRASEVERAAPPINL